MMLTGTWTPLTNLDSQTLARMALLSDGRVLDAHASSNGGSEILTPDANGNYVNGTWTIAAGFAPPGGLMAEMVLPDGRVMDIGRATSSGVPNAGQIYNPLTNTWSSMASFPSQSTFAEGPLMLLPDGRVLAGSISDNNTYIYDPATNTWSNGPAKLYGDSSNHESWTLLPGGSILSYDVNSNAGEAQRLDVSNPDPTQWQWVDAGAVPVALEGGISASLNMGPGVLMPDGRVLQFGRSSNTAIYTPPTSGDGTNGVGSWSAGPVIPNGLEAGGDGLEPGGDDAINSSTAVMLPNGDVLFCADKPDTGGPTRIFEFDPTAPLATSLTDVTPANADYQTNSANYATRMLMLPNGQVLLGNANQYGLTSTTKQLYVYTPDGLPQASWKPTITSVVANGNHFTLDWHATQRPFRRRQPWHQHDDGDQLPDHRAQKRIGNCLLRPHVQLEQHRRADRQHTRYDRFHAALVLASRHLLVNRHRQRHFFRSGAICGAGSG